MQPNGMTRSSAPLTRHKLEWQVGVERRVGPCLYSGIARAHADEYCETQACPECSFHSSEAQPAADLALPPKHQIGPSRNRSDALPPIETATRIANSQNMSISRTTSHKQEHGQYDTITPKRACGRTATANAQQQETDISWRQVCRMQPFPH